MHSFLRALLCAVLLCFISFASAQTDDLPEANPGRPTVSTPATLTPVGYLQFENGALYAANSGEFSTRFGINQVTKLAVNSRMQFLLLSEPLVSATGADTKGKHPGEVFAGVQTVLMQGEGHRPTLGVSYIRRLHESPAPEIDIGTSSQYGILLLSTDEAGFHFDLNGMLAEQSQDAVRRAQYGQSLSVSHPLAGFTLAGELWHYTQPFLKGNAVGALFAASYPIRKNLVVDAGFNRGLTSTSTQWEGFAGITYVLPHRLWRKRASTAR